MRDFSIDRLLHIDDCFRSWNFAFSFCSYAAPVLLFLRVGFQLMFFCVSSLTWQVFVGALQQRRQLSTDVNVHFFLFLSWKIAQKKKNSSKRRGKNRRKEKQKKMHQHCWNVLLWLKHKTECNDRLREEEKYIFFSLSFLTRFYPPICLKIRNTCPFPRQRRLNEHSDIEWLRHAAMTAARALHR